MAGTGMTRRHTPLGLVAVLALGFHLGEPVPVFASQASCGATFPTCMGECPSGQVCRTAGDACECFNLGELGCCRLNQSESCIESFQLNCLFPDTFFPGGTCSDGNCLPAPTPTLVPDGGACTSPSECQSGICTGGVCRPRAAPAPAASQRGLLLALMALIGVAVVSLARWHRSSDG